VSQNLGFVESTRNGGSRVRLVTVHNPYGVPLDGIVWEPPDDTAEAAVVHVHGKGGNFYSGPGRFIPELTRGLPLVHYAVNMRCHDLGTTRADLPCDDLMRSSRRVGRGAEVDGGMWERIADGPGDLGAAVRWLRDGDIEKVFIAGHSSGGFYAARYAAQARDVAGLVLLSPLTSNRTALRTWFEHEEELEAAVEQARMLVASDRGELLIPVPHWYYAISARSLLERANEPPDTWRRAMSASTVPTLWLWGSEESRAEHWNGLFVALSSEEDERVVVDGADHHYTGCEREVAEAVGRFVLAWVRRM
jgi:pimeloyl-ACP methyl ester carboxylesterase